MGRGEEDSFFPLPLPRHFFFLALDPTFLHELARETLATQATCLIDMTIPLNTNTSVKTTEKLRKYKDLEIEVESMWGLKTTTVQVSLVPRHLSSMCAQRKAGRRPAVCTLPMVPCGSSPVTRVSRSPLPCEKRSA